MDGRNAVREFQLHDVIDSAISLYVSRGSPTANQTAVKVIQAGRNLKPPIILPAVVHHAYGVLKIIELDVQGLQGVHCVVQ